MVEVNLSGVVLVNTHSLLSGWVSYFAISKQSSRMSALIWVAWKSDFASSSLGNRWLPLSSRRARLLPSMVELVRNRRTVILPEDIWENCLKASRFFWGREGSYMSITIGWGARALILARRMSWSPARHTLLGLSDAGRQALCSPLQHCHNSEDLRISDPVGWGRINVGRPRRCDTLMQEYPTAHSLKLNLLWANEEITFNR